MSPWVCDRCMKVCGPYDRIERRIEMRDARTQARYKVVTTGRICKACADKEIEEHRPVTNQGKFL